MTDVPETFHSQSVYIQPLENPTAFAKATYMPFAPMPYAVVYDSKMETNSPIAPCMCCSTELCVADQITSYYFDKPPFRSGMCCVCLPCTCCGPPVVFSQTPKCCCLDLTWAYGQNVLSAPCNVFGCKVCLCCGTPCYTFCGLPIINGMSDSKTFMANMKAASDAYFLKHPDIPENERAIFENISDNIALFDKAKKVENENMDRGL